MHARRDPVRLSQPYPQQVASISRNQYLNRIVSCACAMSGPSWLGEGHPLAHQVTAVILGSVRCRHGQVHPCVPQLPPDGRTLEQLILKVTYSTFKSNLFPSHWQKLPPQPSTDKSLNNRTYLIYSYERASRQLTVERLVLTLGH